jgi:exosortase/archaeosortase family protein
MLKKTTQTLKHYYQFIVSAALITILILIVYGQDLQILANEALQNEALSHTLILPFFAGILFYMKKDTVKATLDLAKDRTTKTKYLDQLIGVVIILIAFLTYWYGSYTFYPLEYHILSLPIFILGTTLILFNLKTTLTLLPPTLFLIFLLPIPTQYIYTLGGTMANINTQASYTLLKTFNIPVQLSTTYGPPTLMLTNSLTGPSTFTVDLPCSGIYSLIAFAMFAAFLLLIATATPLKKTALLATGFIIFETLNITRITTIIITAYQYGEATAMNLVHSTIGLLFIFSGMLLTLFIADKLLKIQIIPTTTTHQPCPECETNIKKLQTFCTNCGTHLTRANKNISRETYAKLLLLILAAFLITLAINAPTFTVAQGPNGIAYTATSQENTNAFPNITGYNPITFLYRDTTYEKITGQDASLWYAYFSTNDTQPTIYLDVGVSNSLNSLHNWEVCLYSYPTAQGQLPLVQVLTQKDVQILPQTPLIARYFTFVSPYNYTQVTLYWYEKATFNTGITNEQRYVRISLVILTQNQTIHKQLEDQLLPISTEIANYWEPLTDNSLISLGIPTMQTLLIGSIVLIAFTKTTQTLSEYNKKTTNQKLFNNHATREEKTLLQTIQTLAQQNKTIKTQDIQQTLNQTAEKQVDPETLQTMLRNLEQYRFIKKDLITTNNKPTLVWKTTLNT